MFTKCKLYEIHLIRRHAFGKVFFGARRLCLLYVCSIFMVIRNPGNDWNAESTLTDNESGIRNPRPRIQNPILSWITLINYSTWVESYVWTNVFPWNSRHNAWIGISFCLFCWSKIHFELLYTLKKVGMLIYSWPVPVEWSPEGPVNWL